MKEELEKYIPSNLINKGINIKELVGGDTLAWNYEDIMKIIDILGENEVTILGGDVLNQEISYTGDNWGYDHLDSKESIEKTKSYIEDYHHRLGNDYYYVLVFKKY